MVSLFYILSLLYNSRYPDLCPGNPEINRERRLHLAVDKKSLLVIDMLNDFRDGDASFKIPGFADIIKPIKREMEEARKNSYPIIYLCDCHDEDDREFRLFPPHALKGSRGASIVDELKPEGTDILVRKNTFSGFYNTELDDMLIKLSISKIVITGIITNISVICTAVDALMRGYEVDVVRDAVRGLDRKSHNYGLDQMKNVFKVGII